jgi:hypothetical protein
MSLASPALFLFCLVTHNLRCGLEECRQLRWLVVSKKHAVRPLAALQDDLAALQDEYHMAAIR